MSSLKLPRLARPSRLPAFMAVAALLAPAAVLAAAWATRRGLPVALWGGLCVCLLLYLTINRFVAGRPFHSPLTSLPSAIAGLALWLSSPNIADPFALITLGALTLLAVGLYAGYALESTGTPALRRARDLARRLAARNEWPSELDACRQVPEVKALRDAVRDEAAPALNLLADGPPSVRMAALAALEYRKGWRRGQPDLILNIAKNDQVPEVRAAAVLALGGINQRLILEELANCLRDPSPIVRQAAADAVLWNCERRWIWVRHAVHEALGDPRLTRDGAINLGVGTFSDQAAADLAAWSTEAGPLGIRATKTLALHYSRRLTETADPALLAQLIDHVASPRAAAVLRIELAHLLRQHDALKPDLAKRLLDPANPAPLRLLAVEVILQVRQSDTAIETLRQVARQPNRELALHAAVIVQKYLQVDLGLALGQPPPALHTRQAAEVTRRVIQWAGPSGSLRGSSSLPPSRSARPSRSATPADDATPAKPRLDWD